VICDWRLVEQALLPAAGNAILPNGVLLLVPLANLEVGVPGVSDPSAALRARKLRNIRGKIKNVGAPTFSRE
jgi:hypothetical protein